MGDGGDRPQPPAGGQVARPARRRRRRRRAALLAAGAGLLIVGGLVLPAVLSRDTGAASCALVVDVGTQRYVGAGELMQLPPLERERVAGTIPACDDTGGTPWWRAWDRDEPPESVEVHAVSGVDPEVALVLRDQVLVPESSAGHAVPTELRPWLRRPRCTADGPLVLRGEWLDVETTKAPRFDGDVRAPLTVELRVDRHEADRPELAGARVLVRDRGVADPALTPDDVRDTLWTGGTLEARAHCENGRFVADGFRSLG